jgi:hypothetical protein
MIFPRKPVAPVSSTVRPRNACTIDSDVRAAKGSTLAGRDAPEVAEADDMAWGATLCCPSYCTCAGEPAAVAWKEVQTAQKAKIHAMRTQREGDSGARRMGTAGTASVLCACGVLALPSPSLVSFLSVSRPHCAVCCLRTGLHCTPRTRRQCTVGPTGGRPDQQPTHTDRQQGKCTLPSAPLFCVQPCLQRALSWRGCAHCARARATQPLPNTTQNNTKTAG